MPFLVVIRVAQGMSTPYFTLKKECNHVALLLFTDTSSIYIKL